MFLRSFLV